MMKRREFTQATGLVIASSALMAVAAHAQMKKPVPGVEYQVLDRHAQVDAPAGKIEVVEFFWYSCPHCYSFEPTLAGWVKKLPKEVSFRRAHVAFRDDFVPQQRLFFALEGMGLVEQLHSKVFAAIHAEKLNLSTVNAITEWVGKQGVDKVKFLEHYNSFAVATKARKATQLQNDYRVEGVPALGVAGRFYTDGTMAGSTDRALQVVESLIADIKSGR
jgi:thiol:disulfide interchange protein DsbA